MAGTFDFCPNSMVPKIAPREPVKGMTMNGWNFSSKPTTPFVKRFKVRLYGLRWFLQGDGMFDSTTQPTINARRLELFYQAHECWDNFTFNHPHLGAVQVRFETPVEIPEGLTNSNGLIDAFEITLIEHNPGY